MNKNRIIKSLILCLAIIFALSGFAGCRSGDTGGQQTTTTAATTTTRSATTATTTSPQDRDPVELSFMMRIVPEFDPESIEVQTLLKNSNVIIDWVLPPLQGYDERLNIVLSSGDLPDIIEGRNNQTWYDHWNSGSKRGIFISFDQYRDHIPNILEYSHPEALYQCMIDGELFAIPRCSVSRADTYLVRKDWMDNLGLEPPVTIDDYYEFMRAFAKDDPNQSGNDDTFALTTIGSYIGNGFFEPLVNAFNVGYGWQMDENGKLFDSSIQGDNFKESLLFIKRLIDESIIDPTWIVNNDHLTPFYNGEVGMTRAYAGSWKTYENQVKNSDPNAEVMFLDPPLNINGELKLKGLGRTHYGTFVISSSCDYPAEAAGFLDSMLGDANWEIVTAGMEGIHYDVVNGEKVYNEEFAKYDVIRTWIGFLRRPADADYFIPVNLTADQRDYAVTWWNKSVEWNMPDLFFGPATPTMRRLAEEDWGTRLNELLIKILYNEASIDEYDKFLENYKAAGYDQVVEEVNDWYGEFLQWYTDYTN